MYQGTTLVVPSSLQAALQTKKSIWALAPAAVSISFQWLSTPGLNLYSA